MFLRHLQGELWKLFAKKRTYIGFGAFLVVQNLVLVLFRFTRASGQMQRVLEGNGHAVEEYLSALTLAVIVDFPVAYLLLPLYVALVGGDLVAKEAEDGTLRLILARPISRLRLLAVKWTAGAVFAVLLALCLGVFGLLFARLWFPWGGLFVFVPGEMFSLFDPGPGLRTYLLAHLMLATKAVTVMGLGFMFSCFNMKPAAATILALSVLFVNGILMNIPYFADLKPWFLTHHLNLWQLVFGQPVPWGRIAQSLFLLLGFNVTFLAAGYAAFSIRDLKS